MAKTRQISNSKPKQDTTRKIRADRRQAFLDAAARRMGMLDWGSLTKWARECAEEPSTDQGVNNRLRKMLLSLADNIPGGDPNTPPTDMDQVRADYPVKGRVEKVRDEAGRLATRPRPTNDMHDGR